MNLRRYQPSGLGPFLCDADLVVTTLDSPPMTPPIQPTKPGVAAPINIQQTFAAVGTLGNALVNGWQPTPQEANVMFTATLLLKNGLKAIGIDLVKDDRAMSMKDIEDKMRAALSRQVAAVDEAVALSAPMQKLNADFNELAALADDVLGTSWRQSKTNAASWSQAPTAAEKAEALAALGLKS